MIDRFPREYDRAQYERLRRVYGDRLPPFDRILVRRGLHGIVDQVFARLGAVATRARAVNTKPGMLRVVGIETRAAGWLVVVTTGAMAGAGDVLAEAEEAARTTCEHCGGFARMTVKLGLDAPFVRPDIEPTDRLLCRDCASAFQMEVFGGRA